MTINEAVRKALEENGCIYNPDMVGKHGGVIKIRPTNGEGNCILSEWDGSRPSKYGWQPRANDFIRDDWMVITEDQSPSQ